MAFTIRQDRNLIRCDGRSKRYLSLNIQAPLSEASSVRPPVNIAIVIDRSGSMGGNKLERAAEAACYVINLLKETDRFSVIAYDNEIDVVIPSTLANKDTRYDAVNKIKEIRARGMTNLFEGWMNGCQQIAEYLKEEAIGRCFLLTDGLANEGITDHSEIIMHAGNLRERHVVTSTFGIGADFDEELLQEMASAGGGNFYFIASEDDIPHFINQEMGETLEIVARDVDINIRCAQECKIKSMNDFPVRETSSGWRIALGNLTSGQEIEPLIQLQSIAGEVGQSIETEVEVTSRNDVMGTTVKTIRFEYASARECDEQERDVIVDRRVATIYAARTKRKAASLNRENDYEGAKRVIDRCIDRIRRYAANDAEILSILDSLRTAREEFSIPMDVMMNKKLFSHSSLMVKERSAYGSAKRVSRGQGIVVLPNSEHLFDLSQSAIDGITEEWRHEVGRLKISDQLVKTGRSKQHNALSPTDEMELVRHVLQHCPKSAVRIVFIEQRLHDNWFSHWHQNEQSAIVSMNNWDALSTVTPVAFIAQEILLHGIHSLSSKFDLLRISHEETRGCLFDFCQNKQDAEIKLQTMDVCSECRDELKYMGVDYKVIVKLCNVIRDLATHKLVA